MILIQRYTFKELVYNFVFSFVVISVVILLATLLKVIFQNPMLGLDMIAVLVPFMLMSIMSIVFPAASLVAVVTTYGRMAADNEILALSSSGVHFFRIVVPGILFGLVVSLILLVANDRFVPLASMKVKEMGKQLDVYPLLENRLKRGLTTLELGEWIITWETSEEPGAAAEDAERQGGSWSFRGFRAKRYDDDGNLVEEYYAEKATVVAPRRTGKDIKFMLFNVRKVVGGKARFGYFEIDYTLPSDRSKVRLGHRSLSSLISLLDKEHKPYSNVKILTEIHSRIAQSVSPFVMIFLGLSVAVIFRYRNRMVAFFISLMIAIFIYYPVMLLGETFAKKEVLHPALCIWPGNTVMFLGGVWLLFTVTRR